MRATCSAAALVALGAGLARAQLPSASAAALAVGDNYIARARGFAAVAWNPAGLGMRDNPRWSLAVLPVRGVGGLGPVGYGDIADHGGELLPNEVREEWLRRVTESGRERGGAAGDITYAALSVGRVGVQLSTRAEGLVDVPPDGVELLLFGNAGRTGEPRDLRLAGASVDAVVSSTAAVAYAQPVPLRLGSAPDQRAAVGLTLGYTVGHAFVRGRDAGTALTARPLEVDIKFPVVQSDTSYDDFQVGSGVGLDLGAAWQGGRWSVALSTQNLVSTFAWDESKLYYRRGAAFFDIDTSSTNFDPLPFDSLGAGVLRQGVLDFRFKPMLRLGAAFRANDRTVLSADFHQKLSDGFGTEPDTHAGLGAEYRPVRWLPLRAGAAALTGGYLVSGGLGVELAAFNLAASIARRQTDALGSGAIAMFGVSFGGR
ncbi:MAG TPA: hypothetical protein VKA84_14710 [Gemmatimonadaceae bacterium]|nr:hypothetical protein [Gemmatimonadaceae bacterium]